MSTKRGNVSRTRAQKHKNRTVFKNDLHDKTPQMKMMNSLHVCGVCERCKSVIEWKIKYKKYKPLTQQKTCIKCQNRNIKKAYHVICRDCAIKDRVCAKCLKSAEEVAIEPAQPSDGEQVQLKVEMERLIKSLPERKRRTFLRYMKKGKEKEDDLVQAENEAGSDLNEDKENNATAEEPKAKERIPHTREDLLKKIDILKLDEDDDEDDFGFDDSDLDDFSDEGGSDTSD